MKYAKLCALIMKADKCKEHPEPEFKGTMTIGERGQVVIPSDTRKVLGLEKGTHLLVFQIGEVIVTAKLESLEKIASHSSGKTAIITELLKTIK